MIIGKRLNMLLSRLVRKKACQLEEGIPALLDSFAKQDGVTWPRLAGYGVLAGADEGGVTLNLVEQKAASVS